MSDRRIRAGILLRHLQDPGGITVYTERVARHLGLREPDLECHFLYQTEAGAEKLAGIPGVHRVLHARSRLGWDQIAIPRYARRHGLDVLFHGKFAVPFAARIPTAIFLPGPEQLMVPHLFRRTDRLLSRLSLPLHVRRARAVVMLSEAARRDLIVATGVEADRVRVIPPGVDSDLRRATPEQVADLRARLDLPGRFVLFLGGVTPLKNLRRLLQAFELLSDEPDLSLVLAGFARWRYAKELAPLREGNLARRVRAVGFIADRDRAALYSAATCLALPSLYEGFGMPIIEAMACGCPVLTSDRSGCAEAAGGAAVLTDPTRPEAIAAGLRRIVRDEALHRDLAQRGRAQAARYRWEVAGQAIATLLRELASRPGPEDSP